MSGPFKLKYNKSSFPFKSPLKHNKPTRMSDPPQEHYHEGGKVKWRTVKSKKPSEGWLQKKPDKPLPPGVDPKSFLQPL